MPGRSQGPGALSKCCFALLRTNNERNLKTFELNLIGYVENALF